MTNQEINIAIAEACPELFSLRKGKWCYRTTGPWPGITYWQPCLRSSITADLNAMHEAEKTLTDNQWAQYQIKLGVILQINSECPPYWDLQMEESRAFMHATALQRAEAFLRTLGKWKE